MTALGAEGRYDSVAPFVPLYSVGFYSEGNGRLMQDVKHGNKVI